MLAAQAAPKTKPINIFFILIPNSYRMKVMTIEERLNNIELNQTLLDQRLSDLELKELDAQISEAEAKLSSLNHRKKQIRNRITQGRGSC
ncbi:hemolysin XhlA family protein [Escherichia marmotae]|nr:hemolysin XhlA family protein [Escherichia marmotae]